MQKPRTYSKRLLSLAVASTVLTGSGAASAQMLEEVIVTATKRAESVQDVPISIGVVSAEMMETFDIGDPADLQNFVPGLQVQETFGGTAVRIRGLGSGITNLAFDSSVPIYVDDVYSGRSNSMLSAFLDPGRVEVARGPQGALYGKSTTAGAISVSSARPTEEFEAQIKGGVELEYGGYTTSGYVSGSVSDNIRGRAAFLYKDMDGYTDNLYTGNDDGAEETQAARISFEMDASDTTMLYLKLETGEKEGDGRNDQPVSGLTLPPIPPFAGVYAIQAAELAAGTLEYKADDRRGASTGFPKEDFSEYEWNNVTFIADSEVAEHSVKLIANYNDYENTYFLNVDGFAAELLNTYLTDEYDAESIELRVLSPTDQFVEYIAGAWYQTTTTETAQWATYGSVFPGAAARNSLRQYDRDVDVYSIYGQLTFNLTDSVRLVLDGRYTDEEQDANGSNRSIANDKTGNWESPTPLPVVPGSSYTFTENRSDDSFDPSVRLMWDATDDLMLYGAYAHGSKAGGTKANDSALAGQLLAAVAEGGDAWSQRYTGLPAATVTPVYIANNVISLKQGNGVFDFEDEEADSYELGFKATLLDGAATLNGALFTTEYKGLQTSSYNGTAFVIGNAGQATIDGAELELSWAATDNLRLNIAASYIDATYDSYEGAQCVLDDNLLAVNEDCSSGQGNNGANGTEDQKGEPLERSPDLEFNMSALYDTQITDGLMLKVAGSMYYSDEFFVQPTQEPYSTQDSYTKFDARIALASTDDTWEVAVNGRNLTDEMVISHAYRVFSKFNSLTIGRTVTVEAMLRF